MKGKRGRRSRQCTNRPTAISRTFAEGRSRQTVKTHIAKGQRTKAKGVNGQQALQGEAHHWAFVIQSGAAAHGEIRAFVYGSGREMLHVVGVDL